MIALIEAKGDPSSLLIFRDRAAGQGTPRDSLYGFGQACSVSAGVSKKQNKNCSTPGHCPDGINRSPTRASERRSLWWVR